ncbi:receptor like protein 30-like [Heracleum sosnowskyi]|uniref:Receptor like protein 30-like n=1 Tax=Heracleum sosnowskyi TaxID=360622 RepID=A0AAD8MMT9_9APIA|nr:receptor like protein 30-like [Heracleum sosnowskyi]
MIRLESLDISSNQLTGIIPWQLTSLTFLSTLNLSENHLSGSIPKGRQFDTFGNESFIGNLALCGVPLTKKCRFDESPTRKVDDGLNDEDERFQWKIMLMGYGCGLIFGLSTGYIFSTTFKPEWFMMFFKRAK